MTTPTEPLTKLPATANLSGIMHNVVESEGLIVFSQQPGIWGCHSRIAFQKVDQCWYVSLTSTFDKVMVSHILKAWKIVEEVYGGNFGKRPETP